MNVLKRRSRQVSFRLSEDEYERLCSYCLSIGARSVSDIARSAVCQLTESDSTEEEDALIARKMRSLDLQVRHLNRKLEVLASLLRREPEGGLTVAKERKPTHPVDELCLNEP